uniref:DUF58 domain-containing protein n=1 Tax=Ndongobacter massiliensis TaxID=1871025 RepID=UPI00093184C1|nr:DUF58 domain-containing protein [Ndongobacter massiliensis]
MKGVRPRFFLWVIGLILLYFLANLQLRAFPHILLVFWLLMPILSVVCSLISAGRLTLAVRTEPDHLTREEKGLWRCVLQNRSRWLAFFLRFPELKRKKGHRSHPLELMLRPGETRQVVLPYVAPHAGRYSLQAKEPIFEDLLGFFWLSFSHRFADIRTSCCSLPKMESVVFPAGFLRTFDRFQTPKQRKSFQSLSDEVFSIEPWSHGQSLAHTHWKLSARMQQWMIRHYTDSTREPLRFQYVLQSPSREPSIFLSGITSDADPADEALLSRRDTLLEASLAFLQFSLSMGSAVEVQQSDGSLILFQDSKELTAARDRMGSFPFRVAEQRLQLQADRRLVLWVQKITPVLVGALLERPAMAQNILVLSFQDTAEASLQHSLKQAGYTCLWLDQKSEDTDACKQ